MKRLEMFFIALLLLLGTPFAASAAEASGAPPLVALLPLHTNVEEAGFVEEEGYNRIVSYYTENRTFRFLPAEVVNAKLAERGYKKNWLGEYSKTDMYELGQELGVEFVITGLAAEFKALTFSGWRRDFANQLTIHAVASKQSVETATGDTRLSFTSGDEALDAKFMFRLAMKELFSSMDKKYAAWRELQDRIAEQHRLREERKKALPDAR